LIDDIMPSLVGFGLRTPAGGTNIVLIELRFYVPPDTK